MSDGEKKRLAISPCTDDAGKISVDEGTVFEVMVNPSSYSHAHSISYNKKEAMGRAGAETKFGSINAEKINFDIVLDGTGVVDVSGPPDVKTRVQQLNDIVYKYDGDKHETNIVRLLWGSLLFFGRLDSMTIEYTLFKPSGEPLRARIKLAFSSFLSKEEEALQANRQSPDLSHYIEVQAGDTLPLLCHRIYNDSSYYLEVARVNNLGSFRNLVPGSTLHFPPLR
ncbi:MAG: peptidoglycan-binding protein [Gammaproteobacteria bacterium]|nr:peptidoglycan-binding protein [Gammaproteobacteria bacterium]MCF6260308.1 peptidoglycan-binding protein [Gammaproteobacteria bacterium]